MTNLIARTGSQVSSVSQRRVPFAFNDIAGECEVGLLEQLHSLDERRGSADLSDDDLANVKRFLRDENRGPGASA
jgi:hypothetical protein